ncbi:hypothetical protein DFH11DRAFT_1723662 [Phellopilus nigrolimitatus]|nr:hypothetical protein DFH11DRAFT_1723662 [Phellopilus nigrolimitatus]
MSTQAHQQPTTECANRALVKSDGSAASATPPPRTTNTNGRLAVAGGRTIRAPLAHRMTCPAASGMPNCLKDLVMFTKDVMHAIQALYEHCDGRVHGDVSRVSTMWLYRRETEIRGVLSDLDIPRSPRDFPPPGWPVDENGKALPKASLLKLVQWLALSQARVVGPTPKPNPMPLRGGASQSFTHSLTTTTQSCSSPMAHRRSSNSFSKKVKAKAKFKKVQPKADEAEAATDGEPEPNAAPQVEKQEKAKAEKAKGKEAVEPKPSPKPKTNSDMLAIILVPDPSRGLRRLPCTPRMRATIAGQDTRVVEDRTIAAPLAHRMASMMVMKTTLLDMLVKGYHIVEGHHKLVRKCGLLHKYICPAEILAYHREDDGRLVGVLNDIDAPRTAPSELSEAERREAAHEEVDILYSAASSSSVG